MSNQRRVDGPPGLEPTPSELAGAALTPAQQRARAAAIAWEGLQVALIGAAILGVGLTVLSGLAMIYRLSPWLLVTPILAGPLLGWALTQVVRRRRQTATDPELVGRARELAARLQAQARNHAVFDATMRRMAAAPELIEPLALDDRDAREAARLTCDATTLLRLIEQVERRV